MILRAKPGAKVFSAGHDVDELAEGRRDPLGWDDPLRRLVREIEAFPGPVIAMVEGSVWGGATETVLACDLVVAAEGEADEVWATLRAAREAMIAAGATGGLSHIKVASVNRTMDSLTHKFR